MSNNHELNEFILHFEHSDQSDSSYLHSHPHSHRSSIHQKETDIETESEKQNRLSLQKALSTQNNSRAFEKINANISSFCSNIQLLQDYSMCLGSKLDNKEKGADIDKIILKTADEIAETFNLIEIIINFDYKDRYQKIENITKANRLEDDCHKYKKIFDDLTDKIKEQNLNIIKQANNSYRYSNFSDFSGEIHLNDDIPMNSTGFKNGKEFLDDIEMKRKQNDAISKATKKIEKSLSRKNTILSGINNTITNNNHINNKGNEDNNDNSMEIFNIEEIYKKNSLQNNLLTNNNNNQVNNNYNDNKYSILDNSQSRSSKAFRDMEDKVFIALEGPRQNFIRRHWLLLLIIFFLIMIILYYLLNNKQNNQKGS